MRQKVTSLSFKGQNIYIGIDCHLKSWVVSIMLEHSLYKTFSMNPSGKELKGYLDTHLPGGNYYSAYEAGFCGFSAHRDIEANGIRNIVVNPADIPITDKEKKQKEDKRDSRKIAKALKNGDLTAIYVPSIEATEFRGLVRYRKTMVKEISRNKNRVKAFLHFHGIRIPDHFQASSTRWSGRYTEWLKTIEGSTSSGTEVLSSLITTTQYLRKELLRINKALRGLLKGSPYAPLLELLMTIPGVGFIAAATLLAEIGNINRFKKLDRLCSFVGLVPSTHSSGDHEKTGRISRRSNGALRNVLIESSWIAVRNDPSLALSFNEYRKRMKKNEAIVKIAKKLLNRIRYVMKNEKEYVLSVI